MYLFVVVLVIASSSHTFASSYDLLSATAWVIDPTSSYPDFSASLSPDQLPCVFQYFYDNKPTVFKCKTRTCREIDTIPMPGLFAAEFALSGVSPRRIHQYSPGVKGAQFFLSKGYRTPNRDVEMVACKPSDPTCDQPNIRNTVDSSGFGQAGLRLTFTRDGIPIMLIPEARYASADNRVTGYRIQTCQDVLCETGFNGFPAFLPFNLTGKAYCQGTSVDVVQNLYGYPTWLTLCGPELNLIHCLSPTCNKTSVVQFQVNPNNVYFVYLAVDSQYRFSISTTGQTLQSDITYIRCLNDDCTQSTQYQLTLPASVARRLVGTRVQHIIDPNTDLPVFHFTALAYPSNVPVYLFVACLDVACSNLSPILDYGVRLGLNQLRVSDLFVDDQGTIIASSRVNNAATNDTLNLIVRIGRTSDTNLVDKVTFIQPKTSVYLSNKQIH